ncbi:hypothetical protein TNCT_456081 [Trichonephila clavata]|uniref:Uncharacterized protein n=1 Tax=Trichonephila clavata TaxID=2740835 RepID=A0A8X6L273_TRICU|nr:hypothetical protein TNCT_456081 [Trichonephila clavata]
MQMPILTAPIRDEVRLTPCRSASPTLNSCYIDFLTGYIPTFNFARIFTSNASSEKTGSCIHVFPIRSMGGETELSKAGKGKSKLETILKLLKFCWI